MQVRRFSATGSGVHADTPDAGLCRALQPAPAGCQRPDGPQGPRSGRRLGWLGLRDRALGVRHWRLLLVHSCPGRTPTGIVDLEAGEAAPVPGNCFLRKSSTRVTQGRPHALRHPPPARRCRAPRAASPLYPRARRRATPCAASLSTCTHSNDAGRPRAPRRPSEMAFSASAALVSPPRTARGDPGTRGGPSPAALVHAPDTCWNSHASGRSVPCKAVRTHIVPVLVSAPQ